MTPHDWSFLFGMVGTLIGAAGFAVSLAATGAEGALADLRERVGAAADNLNVALQAAVFDPDELATDEAREHLLGVVVDLDRIAGRV